METFATVDDLAAGWAGWQKLSDDEQAQADVVLKRASAYLAQKLEQRHITIDPSDTVQLMNLLTVTCNLVRRTMSPDYDGVRSFAQSIGSTNVSVNYRENDGGFWLTKDEKELLGITTRGKAVMLRAAIHKPDGSLVDGW